MNIKGILVSVVAPFENHIANGGEKLLGNASSIKRRPDGRVYVSGQMQRHVLFSAINKLNETDVNKGETFVSNGDGISPFIEKDLRADMGGFMHPSKGDYSGRRTAPLSVTPAVAIEKSDVGRDLLVRIKIDQAAGSRDQALATKEFSEYDVMHMNFFLDVSALSVSKAFKYESGFNIDTNYFKHATDNERKRRARLYLEGTRYMNDYASQARNAVSGEPQKVIIVFDPNLGRKASRYFVTEQQEQKNILAELDAKGAKYFIGDDKTEKSVYQAYDEALKFLEENDLFDPSNGAEVKTFEEAFSSASK
ncbi:type I-PGING CRISPR-associated protein Cas7/Csp1 [Marinilabilia salmonicolor]|uniref:CRISPR-associated protein Cst2 n=1 Tax=Marinilabilia salmonicolor TaxID=989 RepID=A0A368UXG0_9BACT|nr:type I-PGING CRISPR-associated protein Cas7/Csp1 [Marinilabilia salmonicolor]RCW32765.1 CRISPR-associated protein Cst2 [Marinilabilia salmonicolor]